MMLPELDGLEEEFPLLDSPVSFVGEAGPVCGPNGCTPPMAPAISAPEARDSATEPVRQLLAWAIPTQPRGAPCSWRGRKSATSP